MSGAVTPNALLDVLHSSGPPCRYGRMSPLSAAMHRACSPAARGMAMTRRAGDGEEVGAVPGVAEGCRFDGFEVLPVQTEREERQMSCKTLWRIDSPGEELEPGLEVEIAGMRNRVLSISRSSIAGISKGLAVGVTLALLLGYGAWVVTSGYESPPRMTRIQ